MWWSNFRQISPAAMGSTGGRAAPFSFTVSLASREVLWNLRARVYGCNQKCFLHVLWLSKKLQKEKQYCAFAQILHICSMHIETLIDRCYFLILKIRHVSPYSGAMLHVSMRFVLLFDSVFTFWHFFPTFCSQERLRPALFVVSGCTTPRKSNHRPSSAFSTHSGRSSRPVEVKQAVLSLWKWGDGERCLKVMLSMYSDPILFFLSI